MDRLYFNDGEIYPLELGITVTGVEFTPPDEKDRKVSVARIAMCPVNKGHLDIYEVVVSPENARRIIAYLSVLLENWEKETNG